MFKHFFPISNFSKLNVSLFQDVFNKLIGKVYMDFTQGILFEDS